MLHQEVNMVRVNYTGYNALSVKELKAANMQFYFITIYGDTASVYTSQPVGVTGCLVDKANHRETFSANYDTTEYKYD